MTGARATLPPTGRLRGARQFTGAFERRLHSEHFLILVRGGGAIDGGARLGAVIARREMPRAVDRSRLRRLIREEFRRNRLELGPVDAVVRLKSGVLAVPSHLLREELRELFHRVETL